MSGLDVIATGMVCAVGSTAERATAAIRAGISGLRETSFMFGGKNVAGGTVPMEPARRGIAKVRVFLSAAIKQCLDGAPGIDPQRIALLVTVAEPERAGRIEGLDAGLLGMLQSDLSAEFHPMSRIVAGGKMGAMQLLVESRRWFDDRTNLMIPEACIVAGADTYFVSETLQALVDQRRLYGVNEDGLVPGEGGAAVMVSPASSGSGRLVCLGMGRGLEPAALDTAVPLRADGYVQAFREALQDARSDWSNVDYRLTDVSGEIRRFKEEALAFTRAMRARKTRFDVVHPAESTGDLGAATLPALLCVAREAARTRRAAGPGVLIHFGEETGERAAIVARAT